MRSILKRLIYLVASLPLLGDYCYKFAKIIIRYHDNDANTDMYRNGEYSSIVASRKQKDGKTY